MRTCRLRGHPSGEGKLARRQRAAIEQSGQHHGVGRVGQQRGRSGKVRRIGHATLPFQGMFYLNEPWRWFDPYRTIAHMGRLK